MFKLFVRSMACASVILIAGSASASSNSDLEEFFESLFGLDSNDNKKNSKITTEEQELFEPTIIETVSVLDPPEEHPMPTDDTNWDDTSGGSDNGFIPGTGGVDLVGTDDRGHTNAVPEPSAALLFGLGAVVVARRVRR